MEETAVLVQENAITGPAKPATLLQAVMAAAQNPEIDPDRLERFLKMGRELQADEAKRQYNIAWAAMEPELPYIDEKGLNIYTNNTYAKWDDIHRACLPVLRKHGFSVGFDSRKEGEVLFVIVVIRHVGGHEERPCFPFPWRDPGKTRTPADEAAAALTKGQRHAFRKAFNILSLGEEERLTQGEYINEEQAQKITDILNEADNREKGAKRRSWGWMQKQFKAEKLGDLRQGEQLQQVMAHLDEVQKRLGMK